MAIVIGPDEIGIEWLRLLPGVVVRYRRCPRRDPATEEEMSPYCRRAVVDAL